jgi:hypothetical protein
VVLDAPRVGVEQGLSRVLQVYVVRVVVLQVVVVRRVSQVVVPRALQVLRQ